MKSALAIALLASLLQAAPPSVRVRDGNSTVELSLDQYVTAVLAGECSVFRSPEAIKAMAVAARTYAVRMRGRHSAEGYDFCSTTHCQRIDRGGITPRLQGIAAQTAGELLWYEGKLAFTAYTRDCGGRAEEAAAVWPDLAAPYLRSHDDPYCLRTARPWQWTAEPAQVAAALLRSQLRTPRTVERVAILDRTVSGRARTLVLSGAGESVRISAGTFRFAIGRGLGWNNLLSDRYEIRTANGQPVFEGRGAGHGVGLCQLGADQMALEGRSYREILAFYYPGTAVGLNGRGISWQRLGGEQIALLTTHPDQDRGLLDTAERILHEITRETNLLAPRDIELRVYPDVETFRNATGEPGWVAARTDGRRIHLQPASLLRSKGALDSTIRHELLHATVEAQAAPALPAWFREGVVEYLDHAGSGAATSRAPAEADLRQTKDEGRARRAYSDSRDTVAGLISRYGRTAVLGWLKTGLPKDVATHL